MIIQGSNNPLVVEFDESVDDIPVIVATLWGSKSDKPIKTWEKTDMSVSGTTAILPISEEETSVLSPKRYVLAIKGLDTEGNTIFWDEYDIQVQKRKDKDIALT